MALAFAFVMQTPTKAITANKTLKLYQQNVPGVFITRRADLRPFCDAI
jgi:hypothetical protein